MENITVLDPIQVRELEQSEIQYWKKYYQQQTPFASYANVIAGGMAFAVPNLPILAMNRVVGLGLDREIMTADLEDIIAFYQSAGVNRFFIQLTPTVLDERLRQLLTSNGFRHYNNWTKHYKKIDEYDYPRPNEDFRISPLPAKSAAEFGEIICDCFGWKYPGLDQWLNNCIGQTAYQHYSVNVADEIVAVAALHTAEDYASMAFAATRPTYRGLGIQQALLLKRIRDARQLGCRYLVSETAEEKPGKPVTSARNMRRMGLQIAYQRQNWIFEF